MAAIHDAARGPPASSPALYPASSAAAQSSLPTAARASPSSTTGPAAAARSSTADADELADRVDDLELTRARTRSRSRGREPAAGAAARGFTSASSTPTAAASSSSSPLGRSESRSTERSRTSTFSSMAHLGDKIKEAWHNRPSSRTREASRDRNGLDRFSTRDTVTTADGAEERGRGRHHMDHHAEGDYMVSTGRGGAGNIRNASRTRQPAADDTPEEEDARARSRERSKDRGHAAGRGGAGNFRSPSRNPETRIAEEQQEKDEQIKERIAQEKRAEHEAGHVKSHGRGGAGNIGR